MTDLSSAFDFNKFQYHAGTEQLVESIAAKANTTNKHFIRIIIPFYLGIIASSYRVNIELAGNRPVPLNVYALTMSASGSG